MPKELYEKFRSNEITWTMLEAAAKLFSENYGVWGDHAASKMGPFAKAGNRVKMSKERLLAQCLPPGADNSYVRVTVDGQLAGHACACRWRLSVLRVCWITQLVVHRDYRQRGIAVSLLRKLREDEDDLCGILSSHPAACMAAARAFGEGIEAIQLSQIENLARGVMVFSPVDYVKNAELHGTLFQPDDNSGALSSANTGFFVDHAEPFDALKRVRESGRWPLGDLLEGHEFLLLLRSNR